MICISRPKDYRRISGGAERGERPFGRGGEERVENVQESGQGLLCCFLWGFSLLLVIVVVVVVAVVVLSNTPTLCQTATQPG